MVNKTEFEGYICEITGKNEKVQKQEELAQNVAKNHERTKKF